MRTKYKLIGSAGSLDRLLKLTCEYFFTDSIGLNDDGTVTNSKGIIDGLRWSYVRGRYRLEREVQS